MHNYYATELTTFLDVLTTLHACNEKAYVFGTEILVALSFPFNIICKAEVSLVYPYSGVQQQVEAMCVVI